MSVHCEIRQKYLWIEFSASPTRTEIDAHFNMFIERFEILDIPEGMQTVMDVRHLKQQDFEFLRLISKIAVFVRRQTLAPVNAINGEKRAKRFVQMQGVDLRFKDLCELFPVSQPTINMDFINSFLTGALNVLKLQCQVDSKAGRPTIRRGPASRVADIAGVIGVHSNEFTGSISLYFPKETFLKLMEIMLGTSHQEINDEIESGAGELLNMIFGQAKSVLNEKGFGLERAIPCVVRGEGLKQDQAHDFMALVVPFKSSVGDFEIEIGPQAG